MSFGRYIHSTTQHIHMKQNILWIHNTFVNSWNFYVDSLEKITKYASGFTLKTKWLILCICQIKIEGPIQYKVNNGDLFSPWDKKHGPDENMVPSWFSNMYADIYV
jgi:hypothetical protein